MAFDHFQVNVIQVVPFSLDSGGKNTDAFGLQHASRTRTAALETPIFT
jgi:hypothetical protein